MWVGGRYSKGKLNRCSLVFKGNLIVTMNTVLKTKHFEQKFR